MISQYISDARNEGSENGRVLLTNVEGNCHILGLKFQGLALAGLGIRSKILIHPTPAQALNMALKENYQIIGLTVGISDQIPALQKTIDYFLAETPFTGQILVGGGAVKSGLIKRHESKRVHLISRPILRYEDWKQRFRVAREGAAAPALEVNGD